MFRRGGVGEPHEARRTHGWRGGQTSGRGCRSRGQQPILPREVGLWPLLLLIPAIRLAQAVFEGRQIEAELRTDAVVAGDGERNVEVDTKVVRRGEELPA